MAITELYAGTALTISTTEMSLTSGTTTLQSKTDMGIIQPFVNVAALAQGDEFLIRIYEKVLSGGTKRVCYSKTLIGVQHDYLWTGPALMLKNGWDVTMIRVAGADRAVDYSMRSVPVTITDLYTQSALTVGGTPVSLVSGTTTGQADTTDGIYQCWIDANNIGNNDDFQLYQKEKCAAGSAQTYFFPATAVQKVTGDGPILVTESAILMNGWDYLLWKAGGTDRTFDVSIRQVV